MLPSRIVRRSISTMRAWQAESPGSNVQLTTVPLPVLKKPNQVLIRVKAASVNPIDTLMVNGYGNEMLSTWKKVAECSGSSKRFPLIPGRDCAGIVEAVGGSVHSLKPGDEVMAVVPAIEQGSHAEFVVTEDICCSAKPDGLDFEQSAALPYVGSTAFSALVFFARMNPKIKPTERVLIHGGSGGLGTMAIQLLKAWGVEKVVATCSAENAELVRGLGAIPVDYRSDTVADQLIAEAPFEVVLDCIDSDLAKWSDKLMGVWRNSVHVTVLSPMLRETDRLGLLPGLASSFSTYAQRSLEIRPIVEKTFSFEELPAAYERVAELHGKGKTVLKW